MEILNLPNVTIFYSALLLMLLLGLLEIVNFVLGFSSEWLDEIVLPKDFIGKDLSVETTELDGFTIGNFFTNWLYIGKMPLLMVMVISLLIFGLSGLLLQLFVYKTFDNYLPTWSLVLISLAISPFFIRVVCAGVYKVMPKDETYAVSKEELIGRVAKITIGTAKNGHPAEAKVKDVYGKIHYIFVEPEKENEIFEKDTEILLQKLSDNKNIYYGIKNNTLHTFEKRDLTLDSDK